MKLMRMYKVKFYGPTQTRGARVGITPPSGPRITLHYDYKIGNVVEQAKRYLEEAGVEIAGYGEINNSTYFIVEEV